MKAFLSKQGIEFGEDASPIYLRGIAKRRLKRIQRAKDPSLSAGAQRALFGQATALTISEVKKRVQEMRALGEHAKHSSR